MRTKLLITGLALLPAQTVLAQTQDPLLNEAQEIALARSAAPASVSAEADIWIVRDGEYRLAVEGSNGNACMVMRLLNGVQESLGPICYDEEAYRTIMPINSRQFRLRVEGKTTEEVEAILAEEIGSGSLPGPHRPAMTYMMSAGQHLFFGGTPPRDRGNWKPHIMLYLPFVTAATLGLAENGESIMVVNEGKPNAFLLVAVPDFIEPSGGAEKPR